MALQLYVVLHLMMGIMCGYWLYFSEKILSVICITIRVVCSSLCQHLFHFHDTVKMPICYIIFKLQ